MQVLSRGPFQTHEDNTASQLCIAAIHCLSAWTWPLASNQPNAKQPINKQTRNVAGMGQHWGQRTAAAAWRCHSSTTGLEKWGQREGVALGTVGSNLENAGEGIHNEREKGAGEGWCGLEEGFRGSAKSPLTCPGEERLKAPPPGLALAVPPEVPVLLVANGDLLTLVARQVDWLPHVVGNGALVATLAQQRVYCLHMVPALLRGYFGKVSGSAFWAFLSQKLYSDTVNTNLPVHVVIAVFKVPKNGNRDVEFVEFVPCDWAEAAVLECTGDGVLPQTWVQVHCIEGANAASQPLVFTDVPSHK